MKKHGQPPAKSGETQLLDPLDVSVRLAELRRLKTGWLDGKGQPPTRKGMDWLERTLANRLPEDLPPPYLYPTPEGGVQAEWSFGVVESTLDIDPERRRGEWHSLNTQTHAETSRVVNCDDAEDWQWLIDQLRAAVAGGAA